MRYDKAPRPLSAVLTVPPRRIKVSQSLAPTPPPPRVTVGREQVVFGQQAVWSALTQQTDNITQLLYSREQIGALAPVFPILASRNTVCREVDGATLLRVAGSHAHQGLVAVVRQTSAPSSRQQDLVTLLQAPGNSLLLVGQFAPAALQLLAHTARYFGVRSVWLAPASTQALQPGAARAASDVFRPLPVFECAAPVTQLQAFVRDGGQAVTLRRDGQHGLRALTGMHRQSVLLVVGADENDLDDALLDRVTLRVRVASTDDAAALPACVAVGIALATLPASVRPTSQPDPTR